MVSSHLTSWLWVVPHFVRGRLPFSSWCDFLLSSLCKFNHTIRNAWELYPCDSEFILNGGTMNINHQRTITMGSFDQMGMSLHERALVSCLRTHFKLRKNQEDPVINRQSPVGTGSWSTWKIYIFPWSSLKFWNSSCLILVGTIPHFVWCSHENLYLWWIVLSFSHDLPFIQCPVRNRFIGGTYHIKALCKGYVRWYIPKIWPYMVQYPHFRILEFPLIKNLNFVGRAMELLED